MHEMKIYAASQVTTDGAKREPCESETGQVPHDHGRALLAYQADPEDGAVDHETEEGEEREIGNHLSQQIFTMGVEQLLSVRDMTCQPFALSAPDGEFPASLEIITIPIAGLQTQETWPLYQENRACFSAEYLYCMPQNQG